LAGEGDRDVIRSETNAVVKILVLCGGRGSRLGPVTDQIPKPLVSLNGKPIIQHLVQSYIDKGFRDFILCTGYRGEMIREFFTGNAFDARFEFSDAGDEASMLSRLHHARPLMSERVFVAYGDTLVDVNLSEMLSEHLTSGAPVTITVASVRSPFGLVTTETDRWVDSFEEKPIQSYYVGHMLLESSVLDDLDPELIAMPDGAGLVKLFSILLSRRLLRMYPYSGPQVTFNTRRELHQAESDFIAFFTHQEESN